MNIFSDREDAGKQLAVVLKRYVSNRPIVFGIPHGGVIVAYPIATLFHAPLGIVTVRKIGAPYNREYAIGAISDTGEYVLNETECSKIDQLWVEREIQKKHQEAKQLHNVLWGSNKEFDIFGAFVILVDDGIATGYTMQAAINTLIKRLPSTLLVASPVCPHNMYVSLQRRGLMVCPLCIPDRFLGSVGSYYSSFPQVTDDEVKKILLDQRVGYS